MVDETATMKWTVILQSKAVGIFVLFIMHPRKKLIAYELKNGNIIYLSNYADRLTVVRSKSGNDEIITSKLTKLAYSDTNVYYLELNSTKFLVSLIKLEVKGL